MRRFDPWPSSPHRPPRWTITARYDGRTITEGFIEHYAAQKWLNAVEQPGVMVHGDNLHEVRNYRPTLDEKEWSLPTDRLKIIAKFLRGKIPEDEKPKVETTTITRSATHKKERVKREGIPDGYVTITELCRGTDVSPMIARGILRQSNLTKPAFGWAFSKKDIAAVKKLIGL